MPRYVTALDTVDLHAPWWSDATLPESDQVYLNRTCTKTDGEESWEDVSTHTRYVERCVIRAEMLESDQQWVNTRLYGKFNPKKNMPIDPQQMAKARVYTFLRMIVEMTDDLGRPMILSEKDLATLPKKDADWIEQGINALNQPAVPVIEADEIEAARYATDEDESINSDPALATAEGRATRTFRSRRQVILPRT